MTDQLDSAKPAEPLDGLVTELLACGAVLSQIIGHMVRSQAAGRSAPEAAPIPEVAHSLIRGVLDDVAHRHSKRDIGVVTTVVHEATEAIAENIFFVGPELN